MTDLVSKWHGPYSIIPIEDESLVWLASAKEALRPGVYLWTVKVGDEYRVNYIGMSTNSITARTMEHVSKSFGVYPVEKPELFRQGIRDEYLFTHSKGRKWEDVRDEILPDIIENFREIRMFFAPIDITSFENFGREELERIESALITQIRRFESTSQEFLSNYRLSRCARAADIKIQVTISKMQGQVLCGIDDVFEA